MKRTLLLTIATAAILAFSAPASIGGPLVADPIAQSVPAENSSATLSDSLDARVRGMLPTPEEDRFLKIPWQTDLLVARRVANAMNRPEGMAIPTLSSWGLLILTLLLFCGARVLNIRLAEYEAL